jgi:hypothetical protein
MLWYKAWLDTQRWFLLGLLAFIFQVVAIYMSYPMDPATTFPHGAMGVLPDEMARLRLGDFRGYIWVRWFSTTLLLMWPVFVIILSSTGFESPRGREYLLSLPVSRRRLALIRLSVVAIEAGLLALVPSLVVSALAPLVGQRYPLSDVLVHSAILTLAGMGLVGFTLAARTLLDDVAAYVLVGGVMLLCATVTFLAVPFTPYSVLRVMNGATYYFRGEVPWMGLVLSVGVGAALMAWSIRTVERREY